MGCNVSFLAKGYTVGRKGVLSLEQGQKPENRLYLIMVWRVNDG